MLRNSVAIKKRTVCAKWRDCNPKCFSHASCSGGWVWKSTDDCDGSKTQVTGQCTCHCAEDK